MGKTNKRWEGHVEGKTGGHWKETLLFPRFCLRYSCNDNKVSSLVDSIGANGLVSFAMDFSLHRRSGPGTYLHLLQIMHRTESLGSKGLGVACGICATGRRWLTLVQGHTGKQTAWKTLFLLEMPAPLILKRWLPMFHSEFCLLITFSDLDHPGQIWTDSHPHPNHPIILYNSVLGFFIVINTTCTCLLICLLVYKILSCLVQVNNKPW